MNEARDCAVCHGSHEDDSEALTCVAEAWMHQNIQIKNLKEALNESMNLNDKVLLIVNNQDRQQIEQLKETLTESIKLIDKAINLK